jgi:Ca2+-binding EF-hand superfamily protein
MEEVEERIFRKQFQVFDKDLKNLISRDDFPSLVQGLGIFVPEEEITQLMDTFDPDNTGFIPYRPTFEWFKALTKEDEQTNKNLANISDDEEEDEGAGDDE